MHVILFFAIDKKLTLSLDQTVIERAKEYAESKQMSLSRIVESYLQLLISAKNESEPEISPFVKSMFTGVRIPADLDYKKEYNDYLIEKYK